MSFDKYSREELQELSMVNLATMVLKKENKAMPYQEIYDQVIELKGFNDVMKKEYYAQFYTDLNVDGRFLTIGSGLWGLRDWYPMEKIEEEITAVPKKKKKKKAAAKKKKAVVEEEDLTEIDLDFEQTDFDESDNEDDDESYDDDEDIDVDFDDDDEEDDDDSDEEDEKDKKKK
ncbi:MULTISPECIES: DNA-directed RNA polymerase subunit delta [Paraliobacillus]|uniref:DNA-directed RNA polymerase subunit delta n=1 Tax=Paraliobacillus TaxID=200903 RepID=UPI000DD3CE2A|nr:MULTISPECIES: DNA-directed RNA polymerase subunit delta [Paraliobacillus]